MAKRPIVITDASDITTELVLQLGRTHSAKDLRSVQTRLTSIAGDLRKFGYHWNKESGLLGKLGEHLTDAQRQLLLDASRLVESIGNNVTHAKEKLVRTEKDTKRRQDARDALAKQLVARTFPLPTETHEERLETIKAALILNRARQFHTSYNPSEFNLYVRSDLKTPDRLYGASPEQHRVGNIQTLRYFMISDLTSHLAYDDGSSVEERLRLLQEKVAEAVGLAALTADERETLRLWKEALSPDGAKQEGQA
ncbi:hypothetical protein N7592_20790 [Pseudomonas juntendi]|jgi:hypothetical protein|uniref:Uncharacterized protein n=3 Tax=Pseudomonas TaxID=286 RepID=A0ABX9AWG0_9PSED|nr:MULTISPECIES: hypothetical protein [Pseudomonas]AIN57107.1 hypothetical protein O165_001855 [Pseudomonas soli]KPM60238.1 hypothetical protein HB4184_22280 [Pseudomonas putida]MBH3412776.1 hypothetical protein [Pseudomonas putida]MBS3183694.1 hypothetical protein [Pseudomonas sp. PCH44]MCE0852360.1 hypothetical protein [Pseudomonas asiatica]